MNDYKVVFQLSDNKEQVYKSLIRQIENVEKAILSIQIEVVAHGPGVDFLREDVKLRNVLLDLVEKGIKLLACQNTLNDKGLIPSELVPSVETIPSGIAHIIIRQNEGWSYIKVG
ncbi:MAG: DsrE family protein [Cytophagaceae bacterium]|nr:DsrE family protein [Cytophagaceae bacterium]